MGGYGGFERLHFLQFLLWEGVVVLKELIFYSFSFGSMWSYLVGCGGLESTDFKVSTLGGCCGLERTDYKDTSELMSTACKLVLLLTIRCLYRGYIWTQVNQTQVSSTLDHEMPLPGGYIWAQINWTFLSTGLAHHIL